MLISDWSSDVCSSDLRIFSCAAAGEDAVPVQLMMKLLLTEIGHEMAGLAQDLIGEHAFVEPAGAGGRGNRGPRGPEKWMDQIMGSLGNSLAGGASNKIGRASCRERVGQYV